jgi:hypothetical protein
MEVFVAEIDDETDAEARLTKADNRNFSGRSKAKLNPADRNLAIIGELALNQGAHSGSFGLMALTGTL